MYFDNYCGSYRINSLGPKRSLKTQTFGKKAIFPVVKRSWPIFSRIFNNDKPQGTICKSPKCNLANTVEAIRSFL